MSDSGRPPSAPQGWSGGARREGRDAPDADAEARLAPHEESRIEEAVVQVGRRGRGPAVAGTLVVVAFLLGLLRPWDLVVPQAPDVAPGTGIGREGSVTGSPGAGVGLASGGADLPVATKRPEPTRQLTCAYPSQWRTSTIEDWAGRQARVWTAAEVVAAARPDDPSIPFEPVVAPTVTAIGWCAPVSGPDRPPLALATTLYRITDGVAVPVPFDRLEPREPDALGELWVPKRRTLGNRPTWPLGRYVIELRSASGGYLRFLGLELMDRVVHVSAAPSASP